MLYWPSPPSAKFPKKCKSPPYPPPKNPKNWQSPPYPPPKFRNVIPPLAKTPRPCVIESNSIINQEGSLFSRVCYERWSFQRTVQFWPSKFETTLCSLKELIATLPDRGCPFPFCLWLYSVRDSRKSYQCCSMLHTISSTWASGCSSICPKLGIWRRRVISIWPYCIEWKPILIPTCSLEQYWK